MSLADRYFFAMLVAVTVAVAALSCGGSQLDKWTDADTASAQAQRNASIQLESVCARDGGPCPGAPVRSIEGSMCLNASAMLYRHVAGYPADAGCRP
jgi:hypothetical protein